MPKIRILWKKIPEQLRHLLVPLAIIAAGYLLVRWILVPADFGSLGHYRASSITSNLQKPIRYAGAEACEECHNQVGATLKQGYHRGVACEACHGPASAHSEDPENIKPAVTRTRTLCLLCHEYLPTRPTGFPQVVAESHNPSKPCVSCHRSHDPKPPKPLKKCGACHANIQRLLSLSNHAELNCTSCHTTPARHYTRPREYPPQRLQSRQVCLDCHDKTASRVQEISRVDGATHGEKYLCWQCHYPHLPEAR
jgi:hypothetical protein